MATYQGRVNQKLAFARVSIKAAEACADREHLNRQAMIQAACFHLYTAYLGYLREVAETYQLRDPDAVSSLSSLVDDLAKEGKTPAESRELEVLLGSPSSWLSSLCRAYENAIAGVVDVDAGRATEISLASEGDCRSTLANIKGWNQELSALITRHRESMQEW